MLYAAGVGGALITNMGSALARSETGAVLKGPVQGGRKGRPFASFIGDLQEIGYVEEEFFLSGMASRFAAPGNLSVDGVWTMSEAGSEHYTTRLVVRRPKDPSKFNGVVILEWINVTLGYELPIVGTQSPGVFDEGFAVVTVSCQRIGLDGYTKNPQGLRTWDPDRYASLSIPSDAIGYDIFAQAAQVVGPRRKGAVDPMGGLDVRKVIGTGCSQSAMKVRAYVNGVHRLRPGAGFDAFVLLLDFGIAGRFDDVVYDPTDDPEAAQRLFEHRCRVRTDVGVPVMVVNSQSEVLSYFPVRQSDTPSFRFWEIAGASHGPLQSQARLQKFAARDGLSLSPEETNGVGSEVEWRPTADAAFHHVRGWITTGKAPPVQPTIVVQPSSPPTVATDEHGNATGGVRLPELEVPLARYEINAEQLDQSGRTVPFRPEEVRNLYRDQETYVAQVTDAAGRAVTEGVILPWRAAQYREVSKAFRLAT